MKPMQLNQDGFRAGRTTTEGGAAFSFPEKGEQWGQRSSCREPESRKRIECGRREASGRFANDELVIFGHTDDGLDDGDELQSE